MMRTEDDLRAAFRALERHAPDPDAVLRAVYRHPRHAARSRGSARPHPLWQRKLHLTLAIGAAAAVAAAALTATLASGGSGGTRQVPSLRARLLAAIDTTRGDILYARGPQEGTWIAPWYPRPGEQVRIRVLGTAHGVTYKDAEYIFAMPAGHAAGRAFANPIGWGQLNATGTVLIVDHQRRTWGEWHHASITPGLPVSPAGIRSEIAHRRLHLIARTTLHGRAAIELGVSLTQDNGGPVRVTTAHLWVDARTYLPMRLFLKFSTGARNLTDYTFLAPTPSNLAKLRPVIPAGYHRSSLHPGQRGKKKK